MVFESGSTRNHHGRYNARPTDAARYRLKDSWHVMEVSKAVANEENAYLRDWVPGCGLGRIGRISN